MMQKNAELKHLLLLRRLPHSGTKEKMASRLIAHDEHQSVYRSVNTLTNPGHLLISQTALFRSRNFRVNFATRSIS